jgi:hypothetical protein
VNLTDILEDHPKYAKLVQVHGRLILQAIRAIPDFADPYSMPFETQRGVFFASVQRVRRDLPLDFIEDATPREPRRGRPAFIDLIATQKQQEGPSERMRGRK